LANSSNMLSLIFTTNQYYVVSTNVLRRKAKHRSDRAMSTVLLGERLRCPSLGWLNLPWPRFLETQLVFIQTLCYDALHKC